jgi:hypothetical protein
MSIGYNKLIETFDRQIKAEYSANNGNLERCESYWAKALFMASAKLSIHDWRGIRDEDFWIGYDSRKGIERKRFTLNKISQYSNNYY